MKRSALERKSSLRSSPEKVREFVARGQRSTAASTKRRPMSPASQAQRLKTAGTSCLVCTGQPCDPAHLIPRGMLEEGQDDARATVSLCRSCHRDYDQGRLDLLPYLEPVAGREELAFAVHRAGLITTLERVTNSEWAPVEQRRVA